MKEYIWLAFAILFMILSIYHFLKSKQKIDLFKMKGTMAGVNGLKTGVKEFIDTAPGRGPIRF